MSRELEIIANEFKRKSTTVFRKDINLYGTSIQNATGAILRHIEQECKKIKQSKITLVVIVSE